MYTIVKIICEGYRNEDENIHNLAQLILAFSKRKSGKPETIRKTLNILKSVCDHSIIFESILKFFKIQIGSL